jgi:hypothetical protein
VNQNQNNALFAGMMAALICFLVIGVVALLLLILFCLTLQRTQSAVRPRNRLIAPGLVWLHMLHLGAIIPILGYLIGFAASIWDLIMVLKLAGSLKQEFEDRGWRTDGEGFGRIVGITWVVTQLIMTPIGLAMNFIGPQFGDPVIAMALVGVILVLWLTGIVCWIIYWVQMAGYGRRLREGRRGYRAGSIEEDYDDEFQPSRRYDEEDDDFRDDYAFGRRRQRADDGFDGTEEERPRGRRREDE